MSAEPAWTDAFDDLVRKIADTPIMDAGQGRRLWEHFLHYQPQRVLDVGTCYGASAAYMAGALRYLGRGEVVTVDSCQHDAESPAKEMVGDLLDRCDLGEWVHVVRMPHSSYAWWLLEEVQRQRAAGSAGSFDFIYIDGAKNFEIDTASVIMAEQLLRTGGWLLLDDLDWRYTGRAEFQPTTVLGNGTSYRLSDAETTTPHVTAVFENVIQQHPSFGDYRIDADGQWGWARKTGGSNRELQISHRVEDTDLPLRPLAKLTMRRALHKLRRLPAR